MFSNLFGDNTQPNNEEETVKSEDMNEEDLIDDEDEEDEAEYGGRDIDPNTQFVLEYNLESKILTKSANPGSLLDNARRYSDSLGLPADLDRLRFRTGSQYVGGETEPTVGTVYTLGIGHTTKGR